MRPESPTFGFITSTPKPGWQHFDLAGGVARQLDVPVGFDTDVNAAAAGEARWGAGRGLANFIYLTVRIPRDPAIDPFPGACPYHKDCLEGLAAGPAIKARWGKHAHEMPDDHPMWKLEAHYLALGLATWVCSLSPERIILGGGIMQHAALFPMMRRELIELLNGYIQAKPLLEETDEYVVPPELGKRAGVLGAMVLAEHVFRNPNAAIAAPLAGEDQWRSPEFPLTRKERE
jgi:fructokinase